MSSKPKVLFVLTSCDKLESTGKPTGWYLPEFAHPYHVLAPVTEIIVASPNGGEAPLDPASIDKKDEQGMDFYNTKQDLWKKTQKLADFQGRAKEFAAIFYVGGHGPMYDLARSDVSHQLIREFWDAGNVIAAVCHGPAALCHVKLADGSYLLQGQPVTGFSTTEEDMMKMTSIMPFNLEDALQEASGGKFEKANDPWGSCVVSARNGRLFTGQNPASAAPLGEAVKKAISGN